MKDEPIDDIEQMPDQPTHWGDRHGDFHERSPEMPRTWFEKLRTWFVRRGSRR